MPSNNPGTFWNGLTEEYQRVTRISTTDFHYGPLIPGDRVLKLLPRVEGKRCLELGCGGGQNSIVLARCGARCVATDIAEQQIAYARSLAQREGVTVEFYVRALEEGIPAGWGEFDLIHSTYAVPFADQPDKVVADAAQRLAPGGVFLLTMGHPLYSGEWVECESGDGVWLADYFHPPSEIQKRGGVRVESRFYTLEEMAGWLTSAGLAIDALREPCPADELQRDAPYVSDFWLELLPQLKRVPVVVIFRAVKKAVTD